MALAELVDASLLEFSDEYAPLATVQEPKWRVRALLMKLAADKAHGTEYVDKFVHKVESVFSGLPKPKDSEAFRVHDLPLLFTADEVQQFALTQPGSGCCPGSCHARTGSGTSIKQRCIPALARRYLSAPMPLQIKATLNHGEWLPWLQGAMERGELEVGLRQAQRYIKLAANTTRESYLIEAPSIRAALELLSDQEPDAEQADLIPVDVDAERQARIAAEQQAESQPAHGSK